MTSLDTPDSSNHARTLDITADQAGQRLDNFLLRTLKGAPRSLIYRLMRTGQVRVNSGRIQPEYRLQPGDRVRLPPLRLATPDAPAPPPPALLERLKDRILWEDRDLLVLDKPAGLAVHKGSGLDYGVIELLRRQRPQLAFLELAHRLDRETSGCLALAKNLPTLRAIHDALRTGAVDKRYLALVSGSWRQGVKEIAVPLRKIMRGGEHLMEVGDGKPARTRFQLVSLFRQASLLEALPLTGRTHQIRVHAAYCGHPIAGDDRYGDPEFNRRMQAVGLRRLFLHAHSIAIVLGGREISVSAPLDDALKAVLDRLETPAR